MEGNNVMSSIKQYRKVSGVRCVAFLVAALAHGTWTAADSPAAGSLLVESEPRGASVFVDGRLAGETPLTLPAIAAGVHRVRLVRPGFLENSRLVTVKPGARASVRTQLTAAAPPLKIVVLEGEGAVNIIQQRTAVAPIVEVRDRNDNPVSGAVVRFAIQKGRASFNGARSLTVTTDALGRATAAGLTPSGSGALQIGTTAAFQGQTAAITIAQTNVLTAAQASAAAAGGGGTAGGGGLSNVAIAGIAGGAGAGIAGAVLASKTSSDSPAAGTSSTFTGPLNGQNVVTMTTTGGTIVGGSVTCMSTHTIVGTFTIQLEERSDGSIAGQGSTAGTRTETAVTGPPVCTSPGFSVGFVYHGPITGTTGTIAWNVQTFAPNRGPGTVDSTHTLAFTGTRSSGVITGTLTFTEMFSGTNTGGSTSTGSGSTSFPVTLR
jgi:hypothetical protein